MKFKDFFRTWRGVSLENKIGRVIILLLSVAVVILTVLLGTKKEQVVLVPPTLKERTVVGDEKYKQAWGVYLASMVGNVTPKTLKFTNDAVSGLLSPALYGSITKSIEIQAQIITDQGISIEFTPDSSAYQKSTDKVFVTGYSVARSPFGKEERKKRTYEFIIDFEGYRPVVSYLDVYDGSPKLRANAKDAKEEEKKTEERASAAQTADDAGKADVIDENGKAKNDAQ